MNIDLNPQLRLDIQWRPELTVKPANIKIAAVFEGPIKSMELGIDILLTLELVKRGLKLVGGKASARTIPIADAGNMPGIDIKETIAKYYSLVKYLAAKLAMRLPPHISLDDLISSGTIGLIDAYGKFDSGKNIKFKTYAEFRIRGAMLDELRSLDWVPRSIRRKMADFNKSYTALTAELNRPPTAEEVANRMNISLGRFYELTGNFTAAMIDDCYTVQVEDGNPISMRTENAAFIPFYEIAGRELKQILKKKINQLPHKEQIVLSLYYNEELTMKEIGKVMGYTESRISQLHTKAIAHLRDLADDNIKNCLIN